jgi:hypothetical protein
MSGDTHEETAGSVVVLRLTLPSGDDVDDQELDGLTRSLRRDLLELPVEDVRPEAREPLPPGAKAGGAVAVGTMLVAMAGSGGLLVAVVETVRSWLTRHRDQRVVLELGDAKLELTGATDQQREQLVQQFLAATAANRP